MKINWKRVKNHFKVFVLALLLTLAYKIYQRHNQEQEMITSPQREEEDRPDAPGRQAFLAYEEQFFSGRETYSGTSPQAKSLATSLGTFLEAKHAFNPRIFCMVNGKKCVFLIKTERKVAEEEKSDIWKEAQRLSKTVIKGYPTVAVTLLRNNTYGSLFVGGGDGSVLLRKEGGVFTLYPYFEGMTHNIAKREAE